jgi:hypothetical protein
MSEQAVEDRRGWASDIMGLRCTRSWSSWPCFCGYSSGLKSRWPSFGMPPYPPGLPNLRRFSSVAPSLGVELTACAGRRGIRARPEQWSDRDGGRTDSLASRADCGARGTA